MRVTLTPVRMALLIQVTAQRGDEIAQPVGDGTEHALRIARARLTPRGERAQHAARLPIGVGERWKQRAQGQAVDVADMNAAEQRLRDVAHGLVAEAPPHERADRFVVVAVRVGDSGGEG